MTVIKRLILESRLFTVSNFVIEDIVLLKIEKITKNNPKKNQIEFETTQFKDKLENTLINFLNIRKFTIKGKPENNNMIF